MTNLGHVTVAVNNISAFLYSGNLHNISRALQKFPSFNENTKLMKAVDALSIAAIGDLVLMHRHCEGAIIKRDGIDVLKKFSVRGRKILQEIADELLVEELLAEMNIADISGRDSRRRDIRYQLSVDGGFENTFDNARAANDSENYMSYVDMIIDPLGDALPKIDPKILAAKIEEHTPEIFWNRVAAEVFAIYALAVVNVLESSLDIITNTISVPREERHATMS